MVTFLLIDKKIWSTNMAKRLFVAIWFIAFAALIIASVLNSLTIIDMKDNLSQMETKISAMQSKLEHRP